MASTEFAMEAAPHLPVVSTLFGFALVGLFLLRQRSEVPLDAVSISYQKVVAEGQLWRVASASAWHCDVRNPTKNYQPPPLTNKLLSNYSFTTVAGGPLGICTRRHLHIIHCGAQ